MTPTLHRIAGKTICMWSGMACHFGLDHWGTNTYGVVAWFLGAVLLLAVSEPFLESGYNG